MRRKLATFTRVGPFAYTKYECEYEAAEASKQLAETNSRISAKIDVTRTQIANRKLLAKEARQNGHDELAVRYMRDVGVLTAQLHHGIQNQEKTQLAWANLTGRDLDEDVRASVSRGVAAANGLNDRDNINQVHQDMDELQRTADITADHRAAMARNIDAGGEAVTREDLLAQLDTEMLRDMDHRVVSQPWTHSQQYAPIAQPQPGPSRGRVEMTEISLETPAKTFAELMAPNTTAPVSPTMDPDQAAAAEIAALEARGITCANPPY